MPAYVAERSADRRLSHGPVGGCKFLRALAGRDVEVLFRLVCGRCGGEFFACPRHVRTRFYCSPWCAGEARKVSRRRAHRKHRRSREGRQEHRANERDRRRRRREARQQVSVGDQSTENLPSSGTVPPTDGSRSASDDSGNRNPDSGAGAASPGRSTDCAPRTTALGDTRVVAPAAGVPGELVSLPTPRCVVCGVRGDRVEDRSHRSAWLRRRDRQLRRALGVRRTTAGRTTPPRTGPPAGTAS